ncbi:hypothetical protein GHJ34_07730 [Neisseria meningitidis]|nr:hypothetical protein [Neisseria meningitidis]
MLPHTGLFLLGKVALQMRIRRCLKPKKLKPNEPDSRFYGNDGILGCGNLSGKRKPLCRHSRAGGNLGRRI